MRILGSGRPGCCCRIYGLPRASPAILMGGRGKDGKHLWVESGLHVGKFGEAINNTYQTLNGVLPRYFGDRRPAYFNAPCN